MKNSANKGRPVIVTTEYRGVFFGYEAERPSEDKIILEDCRNILYWSEDVRGFLGLAANGPTKGCRIGPAAPRFEALKVTSVTDVSPDALKVWQKVA